MKSMVRWAHRERAGARWRNMHGNLPNAHIRNYSLFTLPTINHNKKNTSGGFYG